MTFHKLPLKNEELLSTWIVKIRRDIGPFFKVSPHTRICSRHFQDSDFRMTPGGKRFLNPKAVPSIFVWTKPLKERSTRLNPLAAAINSGTTDNTPPVDEPCNMTTDHVDSIADSLHNRIQFLEKELAKQKQKSELFHKERDHVRSLLQSSRESANLQRQQFCLEQFENSDSDICFYTGFPSFNALQACFRLLDPVDNIIYKDTNDKKRVLKQKKLSYLNQFFLTLVRLRLGLFVKDLAQRFGISQTSVNRYFISWINFMYLKLGSLDIWPTKEYITKTMPDSMKQKFPNLEWIIDAFEIQIQRPSSLMLQSQSYSNYKSRNTVKGLVACTPSGQIGFISQLYTGNVSDRELTIRSGFLDMPHNRDAMWLVDKGFQIADLAEPLGVSVNMPAFVGSRSQMNADEVFHTQNVASDRIHIERAINKIKRFHYFDRPIPLSTLGSANQAWLVCALLTLFQNPIISA